MRGARVLLAALVALAAAGCMRHEPDDGAGRGLFNTQTSAAQAYAQQQDGQPASRQAAPGERGLLSSQTSARPQYAQQTYRPAVTQPAPSGRGLLDSQPSERGLFGARPSSPQAYAQQRLQPPAVLQYRAPPAAAPQSSANAAYAAAPYQPAYTLDAGDKLRVMVFGQDGISNAYIVDAGGNVNLPLIGTVPARGATAQQLAQRIAERLKQGYVREPHVTVEVEIYRPFFILGEVTTPGQYPYVADMTVEKAIAIAGGFAPRASKRSVELTRDAAGQPVKADVPLTFPMRPGDTVVVKERWF